MTPELSLLSKYVQETLSCFYPSDHKWISLRKTIPSISDYVRITKKALNIKVGENKNTLKALPSSCKSNIQQLPSKFLTFVFRVSSKTHLKPPIMYTYFYLWLAALGVLFLWMAYLCKVSHDRYKAERLEQRRIIVEGDPRNQRPGGSTPPRIPRWTEV